MRYSILGLALLLLANFLLLAYAHKDTLIFAEDPTVFTFVIIIWIFGLMGVWLGDYFLKNEDDK